jgi:hypothetical protein
MNGYYKITNIEVLLEMERLNGIICDITGIDEDVQARSQICHKSLKNFITSAPFYRLESRLSYKY